MIPWSQPENLDDDEDGPEDYTSMHLPTADQIIGLWDEDQELDSSEIERILEFVVKSVSCHLHRIEDKQSLILIADTIGTVVKYVSPPYSSYLSYAHDSFPQMYMLPNSCGCGNFCIMRSSFQFWGSVPVRIKSLISTQRLMHYGYSAQLPRRKHPI
jgi:hypothetical protein